MNFEELREKLIKSNVPESWYSLAGELKSDGLTLRKMGSTWQVLYMSERGEVHEFATFNIDEEAFHFFLKEIQRNLELFNIEPKSE